MNKAYPLSEKSLVENCINGNRKSQKELYEQYSPKMFAICLQYATNQKDAENILQSAFVKLFNTLYKFKGEESFEGWIRKIFINTAIEYTIKNNVNISESADYEKTIADEDSSALDNLYKNIFVETSKKISKNDRSAFKLYAVKGYSNCKATEASNLIQSTSQSPFVEDQSKLLSVLPAQTAGKYKYTIQKGDDKRLSRDGMLRVYHLKEPVDIPVRRLLGNWKKDHVGLTLVVVNDKWQIDGQIIKHSIQKHKTDKLVQMPPLWKFVN